MIWNIQSLKDDVEYLYRKDQLELLSPSLESIIDRKYYARYHFEEYIRLLKEFLTEKPDGTRLVKLIFGVDEQDSSNFFLCRKKVEANIVACLQSMHAVADILSHVIYYSLNMNMDSADKMDHRKVNIYSVLRKLERHAEYMTLHNYIDQLIEHSDYKYMGDIVNRSKHRSIVGMPFKLDVQKNFDDWSHGIEFHAFDHDGRTYSERWVDGYLTAEYTRQDNLLLEIGNELNRIVRIKASVHTGS